MGGAPRLDRLGNRGRGCLDSLNDVDLLEVRVPHEGGVRRDLTGDL